jgi:hypothetical protein
VQAQEAQELAPRVVQAQELAEQPVLVLALPADRLRPDRPAPQAAVARRAPLGLVQLTGLMRRGRKGSRDPGGLDLREAPWIPALRSPPGSAAIRPAIRTRWPGKNGDAGCKAPRERTNRRPPLAHLRCPHASRRASIRGRLGRRVARILSFSRGPRLALRRSRRGPSSPIRTAPGSFAVTEPVRNPRRSRTATRTGAVDTAPARCPR